MEFPKLNNRTASLISVLIVCLIIQFYLRSWVFVSIFSFLLLLGFIWKPLGALIERLWMSITKPISYIMPKILLALLFYFILTPVAFISRLIRKEDTLNKKNKKDSLWKNEAKNIDTSRFEKMW
ncbi:MAG: hypothetical protein RIC95_13575 [Vicingaceae bacterium]